MATLLDQKEEVLKIELTKHGRKLLGLGKFQPEYYLFFDDNVIYDLNHVNLSEQQNASHDRILDKTLPIASLNLLDDMELAPLGTSGLNNDNAPAWELKVLNGAVTYLQTSSSYYKNEFTAREIIYAISLQDMNVSNMPNFNLSTYELDDGRIINVDDDYILIDLQELNMQDDNENFQIEITTYDDLAGGIIGGLERKLQFVSKQSNIIDGILFDDSELPSRFSETKLTKNDAQFYLDILVDNEIDNEIITKAAKPVEELIKGTYTTTFDGPVGPEC